MLQAMCLVFAPAAVIIAGASTPTALASPPPVTPLTVAGPNDGKHVPATRISQPPVIDGRLDDAAWREAEPVTDFHQIRPVEYAQPSRLTEVWVLYDEDTLYIGARMHDERPDLITANILRQGQRLTLSEDRFGVLISPFNDGQSGYAFYVNPNSVRDNAIFQETTFMRWEWDGIFQAAAVRDDDGWTAEMAIPFKTLSFDPRNSDWGISFQRSIAREREFIGWTSANREMNPSVLGVLEGVEGVRQGLGLDVVPGIALTSSRTPDGRRTNYRLEPSLDIYYKLTPGLNAALTVNTDFSASEVDERQVNLTRFDLFFPEKRDFFLQDADIFEFGRLTGTAVYDTTVGRAAMENGKPYFSRTIGLSQEGLPIDVVGGGRVSGRVGGVSLGAMAIRQDSFGELDATSLMVGRAVANVFDESTLGVIFTDGDPRSNASNRVLGADFRYRNGDVFGRILQGELWYQQSRTDERLAGRSAWGTRLTVPNWTGWRGTLGVKTIGDNFRPGMGFVNRRGVRDKVAGAGHTWRVAGGRLESLFTGVDGQRFSRLDDGSLQTQAVTLRLTELTTRDGDGLSLRYITSQESLREPFAITRDVTIPIGRYRFDEFFARASTTDRRAVSGSLTWRMGDFYDGERLNLDGRVTWRPSPHFWSTLGYDFNRVELPEGDFIIRAMQMRIGVAMSARLSWENFAQYDSVTDSIGINSRLNWVPEAGQQVVLVANYSLAEDEITSRYRAAERDSALSLKYTFRF